MDMQPLVPPRIDAPSSLDYQVLVNQLHTHQDEFQVQADELHQTQFHLYQSRALYKDLYEHAPVGYFTMSKLGIIEKVNQQASTFLKREGLNLVGTLLSDKLMPESMQLFAEHLDTLLRKNMPGSCDLEIDQLGGKSLYVHLESILWQEEGKGPGFIQSVMNDITDRKLLEKTLALVSDNEKELKGIRSQFLAHMSHEIRTPLGIILGYAEILLDQSLCKEGIRDALKAIQRNGKHLLNIIDEILDLAKVETGKFEMEKMSIDLQTSIKEVVQILTPKALHKGLALSLEESGAIPEVILSDPMRFKQIVLNLLGNAINFTKTGSVRLKIWKDTRDRASIVEDIICLEVTDTGCGVAKEHMVSIFQAFSQADTSMTREHGGMGLGLCLSRKIAEALGGDLQLIKSEKYKGSTFRLTLPVQGEYPAVPGVYEKRQQALNVSLLKGIRILVVEDAAENRLILESLVKSEGASVKSEANGFSAVSTAMAFDFDVVLMDIQMPGMDGYAATELLRRKGYARPIIAVSSQASDSERSAIFGSGFDGYITKPIDRSLLMKEIMRSVGHLLHDVDEVFQIYGFCNVITKPGLPCFSPFLCQSMSRQGDNRLLVILET